MRARWPGHDARGAAVALAVLVGCAGESIHGTGDRVEPNAPGTAAGLGGGAATSAGAGGTAPSSSVVGGATSAGGQVTSLAGSGAVGGQSVVGTGGGVVAGGRGPGGAGGGNLGATAGTGSGTTGGTGSGATAGMPPAAEPLPPPTWDTVKLVLTGTLPPCTGAACHSGSGGKVHLGFPVKDDAQLYTVLTEYVSMPCGNFPIVTPGHPEESALVMVLKGPCSEDVARMPNGCDDEQGNCVPDEYIAAVEQWITDGAQHP